MTGRAALAAAALALTGCGNGWQLAASDAPESLTGSAGDPLFVLKVVQSPEAFPFSQLKLTAGLPGDTPSSVLCDLDDADGDGKVGALDNLVCAEGPVNHFDQSTQGKQVELVLTRNTGAFTANPWVELARATWNAN